MHNLYIKQKPRSRNYGSTELRNYGAMKKSKFFYVFASVGLSHVSGRGKWHGYGYKAGFDRQSDDTGHKCDESASRPQKYFYCFCFYFSAMISALRLTPLPD